MSNKQKTTKLWRILGITMIALVVLAGFVMGSYLLGVRTGATADGDSIWPHPYARFENDEWAEDHDNGSYMYPMHSRGRLNPSTGFFVFGRVLGGLFFIGLLFAVLRMIFFPHWRRSQFAGRFAPHQYPPFYHPGYCCGESAPEHQEKDSEAPAKEEA